LKLLAPTFACIFFFFFFFFFFFLLLLLLLLFFITIIYLSMIPREEKIKLNKNENSIGHPPVGCLQKKTLPQQNRIESLYNNRNALNKKLVSRLSPDSAEIL